MQKSPKKSYSFQKLQKLYTIGFEKDFIVNSLKKLPSKKIIFICDEKIWQNCQKFFPQNFAKNFSEFLLLKNPKADDKNLKIITKKLKNIDFILALGSGTINDLCKFSAAKHKIPYAIFASGASMNGYLSKNASITIKGYKTTMPATLPQKVFCFLPILKSAPQELTKAGIGDIMAFYSCHFDWYLSHKILSTKFDKKPFEILQKKMDFFVKNYQKFSIKNEKFFDLLIEILMLSGIGMTIAGSSNPASQSEHLIAHSIDMKYGKKMSDILHGKLIAVTVLNSAKIQEKLLKEGKFILPKIDKLWQKNLQKFFGKKIAQSCVKEYEEKLFLMKKVKKIDRKTIKELQKILFSSDKLKKIFSHFKITNSTKSIGLSNQEYQACITMAKFIRNRFTCLDF